MVAAWQRRGSTERMLRLGKFGFDVLFYRGPKVAFAWPLLSLVGLVAGGDLAQAPKPRVPMAYLEAVSIIGLSV
jgi:hypothetical protein